jgi:hypothetical protein
MPSRDKKPGQIKDESTKSEIMRRFKANPFLYTGTVLILIIIVIAFVFVPAIVPEARGGGDLTFGSYNRVPIRFVPNNNFHQIVMSLTQRLQPGHDDIHLIEMIWRHAFEETAVLMGIQDTMKQAGFIVPEDVIDREMAEHPFLQENGRFSPARYRAMDNSTRMSLRREVQETYIVGHYLMDLASIQTSSREAAFVSSMGSPTRTFDLAIFPLASFPYSEVHRFAEENMHLFRSVRISSITLHTEREAQQVLNSVRNGVMSFEEAAMNHSQDWAADRGGEMGSYMSFELTWIIGNEEARDRVLSMAVGDLTEVHRTSAGWTFYRVDEAAYQADINDPALHGRIRNYFSQNMRGRIEDWAISEAERFSALARETSFDRAIAAEDITKRSFGPIPLNVGNATLFPAVSTAGVPELEIAGDDLFFWRTAFSTPVNTLSNPIVVRENVMVLLPLEETEMEESDMEFIETYYPFWISNSIEGAHRSYFLNSDKMVNRFDEAFWRFWR